MASSDLSGLRIDRSIAPVRARRRRWLWPFIALVAIALAAAWYFSGKRAVSVQTTPIVTAFPSQQYVVLNATGYVVAQRKAAIASKASGRVEWLGVAEGSRVKEGEVIAKLDARDVVAQAEGAEASVRAARAALEDAQAEDRDAAQQLARNRDLAAKGFVAQASVDTSKSRFDRLAASVQSARASIALGSCGATNGAASAAPAIRPTMRAPAITVRSRRQRPSSSQRGDDSAGAPRCPTPTGVAREESPSVTSAIVAPPTVR